MQTLYLQSIFDKFHFHSTCHICYTGNVKGGDTMGKLIQFDKARFFTKGRNTMAETLLELQELQRFQELANTLTATDEKKRTYTVKEAVDIADKILDIAICLGYNYHRETPIEQILEKFGLWVCGKSKIDDNASGVIYVGGTTEECYGHDKVIFTDNTEPFGHQRFIAAHELAHYLLDCLGDPKYRNDRYLFKETYPKNNHNSDKEIIADRFAAELLMPHDLFREQYFDALNDTKYNPNRSYAFVVMYLAKYFNVKKSCIVKRIGEVMYDGGL